MAAQLLGSAVYCSACVFSVILLNVLNLIMQHRREVHPNRCIQAAVSLNSSKSKIRLQVLYFAWSQGKSFAKSPILQNFHKQHKYSRS